MPRWREIKRFCENDGWELYKDTDHFYYRKRSIDGIARFRFPRSISIKRYRVNHIVMHSACMLERTSNNSMYQPLFVLLLFKSLLILLAIHWSDYSTVKEYLMFILL